MNIFLLYKEFELFSISMGIIQVGFKIHNKASKAPGWATLGKPDTSDFGIFLR